MTSERPIAASDSAAAREWLFSWRRPRESVLPKLLRVLAVAGAFAFLVAFVQVRVAPTRAWQGNQKATVIQVRDDVTGRALAMRAREGGPFPSRFDPATWDGLPAVEQAALAAARLPAPPYVPQLKTLPAEAAPVVPLASRGRPNLPALGSPPPPPPVTPVKLVPVLDPLSGIAPAGMPRELPPFTKPVDKALAAETWRFLLRLDAGGRVTECISLAGGDEEGPPPLEPWLRQTVFRPQPGTPARWVAVGVSFTNQPADGPDAR